MDHSAKGSYRSVSQAAESKLRRPEHSVRRARYRKQRGQETTSSPGFRLIMGYTAIVRCLSSRLPTRIRARSSSLAHISHVLSAVICMPHKRLRPDAAGLDKCVTFEFCFSVRSCSSQNTCTVNCLVCLHSRFGATHASTCWEVCGTGGLE